MQAAVVAVFGKPDEAARCVDVAEPGPPAPDELTVAIEASPINPSDLLYIGGNHFQRAPLPFVPGGEAAGHVIAKGGDVAAYEIGDRVVVLTLGNWTQRRNVKASEIMRVPSAGAIEQFAALRVVPATAYALCHLVQPLHAGDWVIQNAGNSAVGALFIRFAREKGLRTVNIVRRQDAVAIVRERGGDVVLLDGDDLAERVRAATDGARIVYGIDAVAGRSTLNLSRCMAAGGRIVVYGLLSGEPCLIQPNDLIAKGLTLGGFRLNSFFDAQPAAVKRDVYGELAGRIAAGEALTEYEAEYPLAHVQEALAHAQRSRVGKILLTMNP